jgi:3-deoxy-7-phosphoheptulonate synthase
MKHMIEWADRPAAQQPEWPDQAALVAAQARLAGMPPLVFAGECDTLTSRLADVQAGNSFVLMGGDCAETFAANTADSIKSRLQTVLQMAIVLTYGASTPVVKVGRMAGQYFKPRSKPTETRNGVELPSYKGDGINEIDFTPEARAVNPARLVEAYHASCATLNLVRAFTQGGFADLRMVHSWNQDFVGKSPVGAHYERVAQDIDRALSFMSACGRDPEEFRRTEFFAAHEALVLDYEKPLTRIDSRTGKPYAVSGHFVWIGERTRDLDGAHIDFAATIHNPIGVKLGPTTTPEMAVALAEKLNPHRIPGRLTFITRMGHDKIREALPPIVQAIEAAQHPVIWCCDPMHGNTRETASGYKTRVYDEVIDEVFGFFEVHRSLGTHPGGLHIELTGDDVTECVGGVSGLSEEDLSDRYETACDPRLNREQSLELAFHVADMLMKR